MLNGQGASGTIGEAEEAYRSLPDDDDTISTIRTQAFRPSQSSFGSAARSLLQADGFVPAVATSAVPGDFTAKDQVVQSDIAAGLAPPVRTAGPENVVLGGMMLHQVRLYGPLRTVLVTWPSLCCCSSPHIFPAWQLAGGV